MDRSFENVVDIRNGVIRYAVVGGFLEQFQSSVIKYFQVQLNETERLKVKMNGVDRNCSGQSLLVRIDFVGFVSTVAMSQLIYQVF